VGNGDDEAVEVWSDYNNPPTTSKGTVAASDSTALIVLSSPTGATVYAKSKADDKHTSAITSQYIG